jgi:hypothetical protein
LFRHSHNFQPVFTLATAQGGSSKSRTFQDRARRCRRGEFHFHDTAQQGVIEITLQLDQA